MTRVPDRRILGLSDSSSLLVPPWRHPHYMELIVKLSGKQCPRIGLIGAANGDNPQQYADFFQLAQRANAEAFAFKLFAMTCEDSSTYFEGADVLVIGGGSTRNLLALLREWNAIEALLSAYRNGVLLVGASAGINMLFQWCVSDSILTKIAPVRGVGLLEGSVCPHYDTRAERRDVFRSLLQQHSDALPAFGLDDGVAALFVNEQLQDSYRLTDAGRLHVVQSPAGEYHAQALAGHHLTEAEQYDAEAT